MNTKQTLLAPEAGSALVADISHEMGVQLLRPADSKSLEIDLAARYLRLGFRSELADGEMVAQVLNWWRNAASGEVVATPDPSYRPLDADAWMELGPDWTGDRKDEPPVDVDPPVRFDPPVDNEPPVRDPAGNPDGGERGNLPPKQDPTPDDDAASGNLKPLPREVTDVELVAYHWKSRAVLEKTAWRVSDHVESVVGEPLPRLFRPVMEADDGGVRKLMLRGPAGTGAADADAGSPQEAASAPDAAAVNLRDAVAILKMIAGLTSGESASPFKSIAADFDGSGTVGLGDALGVLRHAVDPVNSQPGWVFVDETDPGLPARAGMNPGLLPQEPGTPQAVSGKLGLVGVLRGDVDGSWDPPDNAEQLADTWFADLASRAGARNPDVSFDLSMWGVYPG